MAALDTVLEEIFTSLVDALNTTWHEYEEARPEVRMTVEDARFKWVSCRIFHPLELEYGTSGPNRVVTKNQLKYLHVEGDEHDAIVRVKKLGSDWRSVNSLTQQQRRLRRPGHPVFWEEKPTYPLFLGYRQTEGLQPVLTHIALTYERIRTVEIIRLWTPDEGTTPIQIYTDLPLTPLTTLRLRRRRSDQGGAQSG